MKKLLPIILLFARILFADQIYIAKQKGTDQSIIVSLEPAPASTQVDANVTIKAVFTEPLYPLFAKRGVTLKKLTQTKGFFGFGKTIKQKYVQGSIKYDKSTHTITFKPNKPLAVGFYEVRFHHLMKQKLKKGMIVKPIVYRFYVPEVINGFKLPPEPDPKKNNETIEGIDFNHNGIRDDVERWIIHRYANDPKYPKTKTAIALQYAKASQYIITHDPKHAYENKTYEIFDRAMDCEGYFIDKLIKKGTKIEDAYINNDFFEDIKPKIFNTKDRVKAYWQFNASLSGHMLGGGGGIMSSTRDKCDIDIVTLGEMQ
ncbi:Ig-like domain-containing protein [Nitratiruptor sp. YY09-18]|uniref:Ig-like domain-containing protein n=1 Tax=Nitratiruptor sp. YY09-18 TaxID=2724901 RepID=UPI0019166B98|nr:Ig-like domain-containing protein [Nitratiruptor sp. YY09-18]BCD67171.1 hypothetical protein NitYY0918_C0041 [Nitratiruptor sp. YY09-18]